MFEKSRRFPTQNLYRVVSPSPNPSPNPSVEEIPRKRLPPPANTVASLMDPKPSGPSVTLEAVFVHEAEHASAKPKSKKAKG